MNKTASMSDLKGFLERLFLAVSSRPQQVDFDPFQSIDATNPIARNASPCGRCRNRRGYSE
jgi:hypothetical protein